MTTRFDSEATANVPGVDRAEANGFDIFKPRMPKPRQRKTPEWAKSAKGVWRNAMCARCQLRGQIAEMFWVQRLSMTEIAESLDITRCAVDHIVRRMRAGKACR